MLFLALVGGCAALRVLITVPNVAPMVALSLFAGFVFTRRGFALAAPISAMLISDLWLGSYDWRLMGVVYLTLTIPTCFGGLLRSSFHRRMGWQAGFIVAGTGLASSLLFFVGSNLGAWLFLGIYERTWSDLTLCFVQAAPFFRYTIAGDIFFAAAMFGSYALATLPMGQSEAATQSVKH